MPDANTSGPKDLRNATAALTAGLQEIGGPGLVRLVEAWPQLPGNVRAAILALAGGDRT